MLPGFCAGPGVRVPSSVEGGVRLKRMRGVITLLTLPVLLPVGVVMVLASGMPRNVAGMAAHTVCSGAFVGDRPWQDVRRNDLLTANAMFALVDVEVDVAARRVEAWFPGSGRRVATWQAERGCVLDDQPLVVSDAAPPNTPIEAPPSPSIIDVTDRAAHQAERQPRAMRVAAIDRSAGEWPHSDAASAPQHWPVDVDGPALMAIAQRAMEGAGDPSAANTRAFGVVHRGQLLVHRIATGFEPGARLHGWSMGKTVVAMLTYRLASEQRLSVDAPVVEWLAQDRRAPPWLDRWRHDDRSRIRMADLLFMRDGLDLDEGYSPWGAVADMLYGSRDAADYAAQAGAAAVPGERWRYSSFSSNLLARAVRARFDDDASYWRYPGQALFDPIGAHSAMFETDADGTWLGSSYLWASSGDWARIGQLLLDDGRWHGRQVLPRGILARMSAPARADGPGRGYGAQLWRLGDRESGDCRSAGIPEDTVAMTGSWGQLVAIVPSRETVIVRLGWSVTRSAFDPCRLIADTLTALPAELGHHADAGVTPGEATEAAAHVPSPPDLPVQVRSNTAAMP